MVYRSRRKINKIDFNDKYDIIKVIIDLEKSLFGDLYPSSLTKRTRNPNNKEKWIRLYKEDKNYLQNYFNIYEMSNRYNDNNKNNNNKDFMFIED